MTVLGFIIRSWLKSYLTYIPRTSTINLWEGNPSIGLMLEGESIPASHTSPFFLDIFSLMPIYIYPNYICGWLTYTMEYPF